MLDRGHLPPRSVLVARKAMTDTVRSFFDRRGFLEVTTPIAVRSPGLEPHLFAFDTEEVGPDGKREKLYLHTSPEYAMKRMLGRGLGHIYQIARVFRNGERSATHTPEFDMLEWYRQPGSMLEIMDDAENLVRQVASAVGGPWRPSAFDRLSVSEAFLRAGIGDPLEYESLDDLRFALQVREVQGDTWEDVFHRALLDRVEPSFLESGCTILYGYPARLAALARVDPSDPRRAERFELYAGKLELANAFGELTDPVEQRARFEQDLEARDQLGRPRYPIDEGLLQDLAAIGEAAGIAIGLDRLLMICLGASSIQEVVPFAPREIGP
jgi:elongation factor P--(R)-beta-lysine ligase